MSVPFCPPEDRTNETCPKRKNIMLDSLGFMKSRPMTTFVSQALQNKETSSFFVVLCRYQSIPMPRDFPSFLFFFPLVIKLIYIGIKPGLFFSCFSFSCKHDDQYESSNFNEVEMVFVKRKWHNSASSQKGRSFASNC